MSSSLVFNLNHIWYKKYQRQFKLFKFKCVFIHYENVRTGTIIINKIKNLPGVIRSPYQKTSQNKLIKMLILVKGILTRYILYLVRTDICSSSHSNQISSITSAVAPRFGECLPLLTPPGSNPLLDMELSTPMLLPLLLPSLLSRLEADKVGFHLSPQQEILPHTWFVNDWSAELPVKELELEELDLLNILKMLRLEFLFRRVLSTGPGRRHWKYS